MVFRYEQAWSDAHRALPARLFLAAGEGEQASGSGWRNEGFPDDAIRAVRQVANHREFAAALERRNYDGFHQQTTIFPDEYHLTVFPAAFGRGLRWVIDQAIG